MISSEFSKSTICMLLTPGLYFLLLYVIGALKQKNKSAAFATLPKFILYYAFGSAFAVFSSRTLFIAGAQKDNW